MRVAVDVTPLLEPRAGIGTYVAELLPRLAARPGIDVVAYAVTWRGRDRLADILPPGMARARGPMAAAPLWAAWRRVPWPPIEWWTGPVDVVLGTNFVAAPARRAATVAVVHDLTAWRFPELVTRSTGHFPALVGRAIERGAHVLTVSRHVADEAVTVLGAPAERVHWVHNGLGDPVAGSADEGRRLAGGPRYVLALGTIEPRKDLPTLVRAFDVVAASDPDVRLVVAGRRGWGAEEYDAAVAAAAHRDRIVAVGHVDEGRRADLLAGATVFAYPSRYEGFGLPPLEAMQAGVPVVATSAGAIPEVVGDAASLVPPGDVEGLAGALRDVLTDDARREALIAAGHRRAAGYSWDDTAAGVADVLEQAAGARR
jgi:glycosyltransferase involved in cell wall biosynthesis